jgi:hypothetical protein
MRLLKQLLMFVIGRKAARGFARSIGLGRLASIIGIIGGVRHMRRHA